MKLIAVNGDRGIAPDGSKGAAIHLRSLLGAFAEAGHELLLRTRRAPKAELSFPWQKGAEAAQIVESVRALDADFVYERYSLAGTQGLEAARACGRPLVLEVNAPLVAEATRHRPETLTREAEEIERRLWREADLVVPVSTRLAKDVAEVRGHVEGIHVLPNGVDPALFAAEPAPLREEGPWTLAFLGHPKPWHGLRLLVETMAELAEAGLDCRLVVLGGGPGAEALRDELEARGLADRLTIRGPLAQEEALHELSLADVSLAPYDSERDFYFSPLKVFESLAAGVATVASRCGDLPELFEDVLAFGDAGNASAHASAIRALIEDPEGRDALRRRGRAKVLERHRWSDNVERIVTAVRALPRREIAR